MNSVPTFSLAADADDMETADLLTANSGHWNHSRRDTHPGAKPIQQRPEHSPVSGREALYAEFAPLVKRLLRQYGTDPELRQDLAGEIYWRFCSLVAAYDPERGVPLRPYLIRQLTASVYTYVRRQWTRKSREVSEDWSDASRFSEPSYDPTASWVGGLSQQQVLATLQPIIAQLPDRQRKVVLWRYYKELPFEEIASLLNVEPSTCRSLLRHALNNLRKQMQASDCGQ